jgi:hypothetical protein
MLVAILSNLDTFKFIMLNHFQDTKLVVLNGMMLIITSEFFVNLVIKNTMKNTQHIINVF